MIVLGIDPGNTHSAGVILENGRIIRMFREENAQFLKTLQQIAFDYRGSGYLAANFRVCCEMICSYGMSVGRSVFDTCRMVGRIESIFPSVDLVSRIEVKNQICHSSKAKDSNVRQALIDTYGPPGTKKNPGGTYGVSKDLWAALAVATAYSRGVKLYE